MQKLWLSISYKIEEHTSELQSPGIPAQYTELIWEALPTVPHNTEIAQELREAMEEPPTEKEFRWALHDQKKSTTPGMSNVTYGNIKDWHEELITHCYQLLECHVETRAYLADMERKMSGTTGQNSGHGRYQQPTPNWIRGLHAKTMV